MKFSDYVNWTEAQWKEYAEKEMTITLEDLGRFLDACELLRDGARLNSNEREVWKDVIAESFSTYLEAVMEITHDSLLQ